MITGLFKLVGFCILAVVGLLVAAIIVTVTLTLAITQWARQRFARYVL